VADWRVSLVWGEIVDLGGIWRSDRDGTAEVLKGHYEGDEDWLRILF
jgi:hypothetical protein